MNRQDPESSHSPAEDRYFNTAELIVGTTMMFVGFLNIFLSISSGFEISVFPVVLYFAGMAIWGHATIKNLTTRYVVMIVAIVLALAFLHYGEVLFWHKQALFWGTVAIVVFFMFKTSAPPQHK
jgi:cation transport ATPase